ncbi:helix-turn-helix domain-containing protein [Aeromicrobium sp. 9AM]|uniref:helix-turn-helix domain-containing protein n=1 Tax=Aeromicrobium sp. 9AM TaxID=2653126 RepID=UPI0012F452E2|nr:helix-turn-helix domain-containing protein [Aeromicrobium sp. 9AM]VXB82423.1 conserved hypothetical protein [Aeromicrobium sp. 9AM]
MALPPISDTDRALILKLHGEGKSRNDIARETGRAAATVTKTVHAAGLTFDRSKTEAATAAKKADAAALRAQLELDYLEDAQRLRRQLWEPCIAFNFGGKDNTYNSTELDEPIFADKLKIMQASTSAANASLRIEAARNDGGTAAARSLITDLAAAFGFKPADPDADA